MAISMGIGRLGAPDAVLKRKMRWTLEIADVVRTGTFADVKEGHICKIAMRPSFSFDQQEVQHVSEKVYLPGKPTWEPLDVTLYDMATESYAFRWLTTFYDPTSGVIKPVAEAAKREATLLLFDGKGNTIEHWRIYGCWPANIVWGDLDYATSDTVDVKLTIRYDRAVQIVL